MRIDRFYLGITVFSCFSSFLKLTRYQFALKFIQISINGYHCLHLKFSFLKHFIKCLYSKLFIGENFLISSVVVNFFVCFKSKLRRLVTLFSENVRLEFLLACCKNFVKFALALIKFFL